MNATSPFTLYRPTQAFRASLSVNTYNLELHRDRTCCGYGEKSLLRALMAINIMINKGFLVKAAIVDCEFDRVFEKTNSISQSWLHNHEVKPYDTGDDGYGNVFMSSTSVGDIFSDAEGRFFLVMPDGMTELVRDVNLNLKIK